MFGEVVEPYKEVAKSPDEGRKADENPTAYGNPFRHFSTCVLGAGSGLGLVGVRVRIVGAGLAIPTIAPAVWWLVDLGGYAGHKSSDRRGAVTLRRGATRK